MGTYNDFSQALDAAGTSSDYFSSLLGSRTEGRAPAKPRRTTVVTPATIARVREEQAEAARAAERAAAAEREDALREELAAQQAACESLATDLAAARLALEEATARAQAELERVRAEAEQAVAAARQAQAEAGRAAAEREGALRRACAEQEQDAARLRAQLAEAQRTSLSSSVLLEKPAAFSEKFPGEIREHVVAALAAANDAAEAAGRDRRARILEAVLGANPATGELELRRDAVRRIFKDAGANLDDAALSALAALGFRYVSGNKHHKLEWAGIRFPLAKTPSDRRACLNSAAEVCNRVF